MTVRDTSPEETASAEPRYTTELPHFAFDVEPKRCGPIAPDSVDVQRVCDIHLL